MKIRMLLATVCASLLVVPAAFAELSPTMSLVGDVETNTTVESFSNESPDSDSLKLTNDGRTHIKFEGRTEAESGYYGYAKGDAMISTSGTTGVDDAFVEFGTPSWAFKVGRYEAEDLFSKGEDVYIAEPSGFGGRYEGNYARGRSDKAGNMGMRFNAGETMTIYIDSLIGNSSSTLGDGFNTNLIGVRPMIKFASGNLTVKAGFDYLHEMPQDTEDNDYSYDKMGGAIDLAVKAGSIDLGTAFAYGTQEIESVSSTLLAGGDRDVMSSFVYAKIPVGESNLVGLGFGYSAEEVDVVVSNSAASVIETNENGLVETYLCYIMQMPVDKLKMKLAASYAIATTESAAFAADTTGAALVVTDADNTAFGVRVRFNYDF